MEMSIKGAAQMPASALAAGLRWMTYGFFRTID
jgi:hypothetical protein